jgi:hypothetical protein
MPDPTPGTSKATAAVSAAVIGGAVAKIVTRIIQHAWPWFLDENMADVVSTLSVGAVVWIATFATPHDIRNPST